MTGYFCVAGLPDHSFFVDQDEILLQQNQKILDNNIKMQDQNLNEDFTL